MVIDPDKGPLSTELFEFLVDNLTLVSDAIHGQWAWIYLYDLPHPENYPQYCEAERHEDKHIPAVLIEITYDVNNVMYHSWSACAQCHRLMVEIYQEEDPGFT